MNNEELKASLELKAKIYNDRKGNELYYDCPVCKNKGFIAKVIYDDEVYKRYIEVLCPCSCKEKRETLKKASKSGLGEYINKQLNDYQDVEQWQKGITPKAIDYLKNDNDNWFIALGQSGCGKTLICSIIANYFLLEKNIQVYYITWTDFISKLKRDVMSDKSNEVSDYLEDIKNVEVLFIDEMLKKYNETDLKYLIEIINYRYTKNLKTIITSERTVDELIEIDESVFSRMVEKANKYLINISKDRKKNYRLKGLYGE